MAITECTGYKTLLAAVERDEARAAGFHDYRATLAWAVARAEHYAEKTGLNAGEILDAWESNRNYWYMNYYQDANFPLIEGDAVRVFGTIDDYRASVGKPEFRCPKCAGVSSDPYTCDAGDCDWKAYGLFKTLGKGVYVFVKSELFGSEIFMPVAWEDR